MRNDLFQREAASHRPRWLTVSQASDRSVFGSPQGPDLDVMRDGPLASSELAPRLLPEVPPENQDPQERREEHDRIDTLPALRRPVHVGEIEDERELVEDECGADPEEQGAGPDERSADVQRA